MQNTLSQKLKNYQPNQKARDLVHNTPILLLVGPTGAGKDSLKEKLLETGKFHHIVSHTTRKPRVNHGVLEKDGEDYHFISKSDAERLLDDQAMIEAKVYSDNLYGTSVSEIQVAHDEGKIAMTDIEVQGVSEYKQLDPSVMAVFLLPPDFDTWQLRLQKRYGEVVDFDDFKLRLQTALDELDELLSTDNYVAVINDDLDQTYKQISKIVESADHKSEGDPQARQIAEKLRQDIKAYLDRI
jgi:guanylate kinase